MKPYINTQRSSKRSRAFTLVELLVVIGIIALLAGLLLSALGKGTDAARGVECVQHLSQLSKGWLLQVQDSPLEGVGRSGYQVPKVQNADGTTWRDTLLPYVGDNEKIFRCPQQANTDAVAGYGMNPLAGASWWYAANSFSAGFLLTPDDTRPRPLQQIHKQASTVILCESGYVTDATLNNTSDQWAEDPAQPWKPYVAFSFTDTWSGQLGTPITHGYDWGNSVNGSGVGAMGWDEHYRALGRHEHKCSAAFATGEVRPIEIRKLTDPEWGKDDCLFDNQLPTP